VHGVHHDLHRPVKESLSVLGVEPLDQLGRALDVGEQDRDLLALALQGVAAGQATGFIYDATGTYLTSFVMAVVSLGCMWALGRGLRRAVLTAKRPGAYQS